MGYRGLAGYCPHDGFLYLGGYHGTLVGSYLGSGVQGTGTGMDPLLTTTLMDSYPTSDRPYGIRGVSLVCIVMEYPYPWC
jgi:hypothetical protein